MKQNDKRRVEIVAGVMDCRVRYWLGSPRTMQPYRHLSAKQWQQVKIVDIVFLLRSLHSVLKPNPTYWWQGMQRRNQSHFEVLPWEVWVVT